MIIQTQRLILRPIFLNQDAPFFLDLMNSPKYKENISDRGITTIRETKVLLKQRFLSDDKKVFVIVDGRTKEVYGSCGLYTREGLRYMDLGYAIHPNFYRRGIAFEASKALIHLAKYDLKQVGLDAITALHNQASQNLLEKLSFRKLGLIKIPEYQEQVLHFQLIF